MAVANGKVAHDDLSVSKSSDNEEEEDLDTSACKTCNLTFTTSKAFYAHIYSVSHLRKTSDWSGDATKVTLAPVCTSSRTPVVDVNPPCSGGPSRLVLLPNPDGHIPHEPLLPNPDGHTPHEPLLPMGMTNFSYCSSRLPAQPVKMNTSHGSSLLPTPRNFAFASSIYSTPQINHEPLIPSTPLLSTPKEYQYSDPWQNDECSASYAVPNNMHNNRAGPMTSPIQVTEESNGRINSHVQNISHVAENTVVDRFEPLIEGRWMMQTRKKEDVTQSFSCEICSLGFSDQLLFDLHMAGLRHFKNSIKPVNMDIDDDSNSAEDAVACESTPVEITPTTDVVDIESTAVVSQTVSSCNDTVVDSVVEVVNKKLKMTNIVERNVDIYKELNKPIETSTPQASPVVSSPQIVATPMEPSEKKRKVADILERNVDVFQKLSTYVEPILGVDYITEYRFLDGRIECVCHLCETSMSIPINLTEHSSSAPHLLRYIFYHDKASYQLISTAGKLYDLTYIQQIAADVEKRDGRKLHTRVMVEAVPSTGCNVTSPMDRRSQWLEQKDDLIRPISALYGHSLNTNYSYQRLPGASSPAKDLPSLLQSLARYSCIASGRPPSMMKTVSRMDLFSTLASFEVTNDSDAEVSLQIANSLTLALLSYRIQMLPNLRPSERERFESRLVKLHEEADAVATKTSSRSLPVENPIVTTSS